MCGLCAHSIECVYHIECVCGVCVPPRVKTRDSASTSVPTDIRNSCVQPIAFEVCHFFILESQSLIYSLGLFCHLPLKRNQWDWNWRVRMNGTPTAIACMSLTDIRNSAMTLQLYEIRRKRRNSDMSEFRMNFVPYVSSHYTYSKTYEIRRDVRNDILATYRPASTCP